MKKRSNEVRTRGGTGQPMLVVVLVLVLSAVALTAEAQLISGLTPSASTQIAGNRAPQYTVDFTDATLTSGGDTNTPTDWRSLGFTQWGSSEVWASAVGPAGYDDDQWYAVELPSPHTIEWMNLFNIGDQQSGYQDRGVNQADIYYRVGGGLGNNAHLNGQPFDDQGWTLLGTAGTQTFLQGPDGVTASAPNTVSLSNVVATAVALDINSNHGNGQNIVGINEFQLFGAPYVAPLPDLNIDAGSTHFNFNFGEEFIPAPGTDVVTRSITYINDGDADLVISNITLTTTAGGAFALSAPSTPFTLNTGDTFTVSVDLGTAGGTGVKPLASQVLIGTSFPSIDRDEAVQATVLTDGDPVVLNVNPTLDVNLDGWATSAGGVAVTGFVANSVGAARVRGQGDPDGNMTESFGQELSIPEGYDVEISFWMATSDYYSHLGAFGDRSFQYVLFSDNAIPQDSNALTDGDLVSAMVSLGYFPDGTALDATAGFYIYDGTNWNVVTALGSIAASSDTGLDGALGAGDTINAYQVTIAANGFGTPSASYDISISSANSTSVAFSTTGLTTFHNVDITSSVPGGHTFTAGDQSVGSGDGGAFTGSFWVDEIMVAAAGAAYPYALLNVVEAPTDVRALEGQLSQDPGILRLGNAGTGADLAVDISFSDSAFSLVGSNAAVTTIADGEVVDYEIAFDAAGLSGELAVPVDITVVSDGVGSATQEVATLGLVYVPGDPVFNETFDIVGLDDVTDTDAFAGWDELGSSPSLTWDTVPLAPTGTRGAGIDNAAYLWQWLQFPVEGFDVEMYFAVSDAAGSSRQFHLLLGGSVNLLYAGDTWQAYNGSAYIPILAGANNLQLSDDGGDGDFGDGDTLHVYRLNISARDLLTAGREYDIEVYDSANNLLDSVTTNLFNVTDLSSVAYAEVSARWGTHVRRWVDNFTWSNIDRVPSDPSTITFYDAGPAGASTVRFVDTEAPTYLIDLADDPDGFATPATIPVDLGTADTTTYPGEIEVDFTDPAPGAQRTLRIRTD